MTKVIVLGQEPKEEKKLKPIEFNSVCFDGKKWEKSGYKASEWENIELIAKNFSLNLDLMFCYDKERNDGALFLGHFNDGVVE